MQEVSRKALPGDFFLILLYFIFNLARSVLIYYVLFSIFWIILILFFGVLGESVCE